jgi:hypothetical protein
MCCAACTAVLGSVEHGEDRVADALDDPPAEALHLRLENAEAGRHQLVGGFVATDGAQQRAAADVGKDDGDRGVRHGGSD